MHIVILSIKWHKAICAPDILLSSREHTLTFLLSKGKTLNKTNMGIVTLLSDTPFHPFRKQSINGGWLSKLFFSLLRLCQNAWGKHLSLGFKFWKCQWTISKNIFTDFCLMYSVFDGLGCCSQLLWYSWHGPKQLQTHSVSQFSVSTWD